MGDALRRKQLILFQQLYSLIISNKIFNYNETNSGTTDAVLGLKLNRKELQQVNDIEFKDFLSDKVYYGPNEIKSYYFWDKFDITPDVSANQDVPPRERITNREYGNNWNSTGTIKQRVVKKYVADYDDENAFEVPVTPNVLPNGMYDIEVFVNEEPLSQDTPTRNNDFYYNTSNKRVREQYYQNALAIEHNTSQIFKRAKVDNANLNIQTGYIKPLMNLFKKR